MKTAIILSVTAIVLTVTSIWMNINWRERYERCDEEKQECYKKCRESWDAQREISKKERERIDSIDNSNATDTFAIYTPTALMRQRLSDKMVDDLIAYLKCKEACEEKWEDCVGED